MRKQAGEWDPYKRTCAYHWAGDYSFTKIYTRS